MRARTRFSASFGIGPFRFGASRSRGRTRVFESVRAGRHVRFSASEPVGGKRRRTR